MTDSRLRDSGVTLIEVLVVLTLIAVSAGVVTLALPGTPSRRSITQEAELLASRLNLATERSLIEGRRYRFDWEPGTYAFQEWKDQEWRPLSGPAFPGTDAVLRDASLMDRNGFRHGQVIITPDLLPPANGILEMTISSGANRRIVIFDGLAARLDEVQP